MYIEEIIIRGKTYYFDFDFKPSEEELIKAIDETIKGIGGRPRDRG